MHSMQLPRVLRHFFPMALSRQALAIRAPPPSRPRSTLAWTHLSPHISHAQRSQWISRTDPNDTASVVYRCTHTSPPLVVFSSPLMADFDGSSGDTAICTLGSWPSPPHAPASEALVRLRLTGSRTHPDACIVHVPPSALAIIPPLMYWPDDPDRMHAPPELGELIPLASPSDLGALASTLAESVAPQPQAILSHFHPAPLIPSLLGTGSFAGIVHHVFARLKDRICAKLRNATRPMTADDLATELLGPSMPDMVVRLPTGRFADAVASMLAELQVEGKVRDVVSPVQSDEAYQFKASHGALGRSASRVEDVTKLDPERVFGPGGLNMRQIMDKVKAADQQGRGNKVAGSQARAETSKREASSQQKLAGNRSGKWVWVA